MVSVAHSNGCHSSKRVASHGELLEVQFHIGPEPKSLLSILVLKELINEIDTLANSYLKLILS